jgi:uncharacterized UPF0160 family protein
MIDNKSFKLPAKSYISTETGKSQIILAHTFNHDMRHFNGWLHRNNGNYKKTASYTISQSGIIYEHFDPKYYSRFFKNYEQNLKSVVILIENDGWLIKDSEKNQFLTWIGDIYKEPTKVVEKRWRGFNYWSSYTDKQFESAIDLVKLLCDRFCIPLNAISHNTKVEGLNDYNGVLYKSNLEKHYTDLSPSWNSELFKTKLEENETTHQ